jgi:hypothetical protein
VQIALPLALGGLLYLAAFYSTRRIPKRPSTCWSRRARVRSRRRRWTRLRAGLAPLVVLASSIALFGIALFGIALFGIARTSELRHALRAPLGDARGGRAAPELPLPQETGAALAAILPQGSLGLQPRALGLNMSATLYSWRSLWPIEGAGDSSPDSVAARVGLSSAPRWLALPEPLPARLSDSLSALRASLVGDRPPDASSAGWSAWRLR